MSTVLRPNWLHCFFMYNYFYSNFILTVLILFKAFWITIVYDMCYMNKLALPQIVHQHTNINIPLTILDVLSFVTLG